MGNDDRKKPAKKPAPDAARKKPEGDAAAPEPTGLRRLLQKHDPLTGVVLTIPVFLVYHLGILLIDLRNGVDLVSTATFALLEESVLAYIGVTLGVAAGIGGVAWFLRRRGKIRPIELVPVLIESSILAVIMLVTVGWATGKVMGNQIGPDEQSLGIVEVLVLSAGAGFHEELVFRVGLFAGGTWLLVKSKRVGEVTAFVLALVVSSLIFSAVHYVGSLGDDFTFASFTFRMLAGVYLAVVFRVRGFAVAVYTHAIYDVGVMLFL